MPIIPNRQSRKKFFVFIVDIIKGLKIFSNLVYCKDIDFIHFPNETGHKVNYGRPIFFILNKNVFYFII